MLNTTINKIEMILTSKILMVKPNNFRSNEETIVNNFFQENSLEIPNNVLNKILLVNIITILLMVVLSI